MGQYIPDITERFPEGYGGVDMTPSFFGEPVDWSRAYQEDEYDYEDYDETDKQARGPLYAPLPAPVPERENKITALERKGRYYYGRTQQILRPPSGRGQDISVLAG